MEEGPFKSFVCAPQLETTVVSRSLSKGASDSSRQMSQEPIAPSTNQFWTQPPFSKMQAVIRILDDGRAWQKALKEDCLDPLFQFLMRVGGLPMDSFDSGCNFNSVYLFSLRSLFISCAILCASRLFYPVRPAFYHPFTNTALLLLHLWLPFAHTSVHRLITVKRLSSGAPKKLDDIVEDADTDDFGEDILGRSSLQHVLAYMATHYKDLKMKHMAQFGSEYVPISKEEFMRREASGTLLEIHEYDYTFQRMRSESKMMAYLCIMVIFVCSGMVVVGWVYYDFFSPEFTEENSRHSTFERYYFGIISGVAFLVIVIPWLCSIMAIFGLLNTLVVALSGRVGLFRCEVERCFRECMEYLDDEMIEAEGGDPLFKSGVFDGSDGYLAGTSGFASSLKYGEYFTYPTMGRYPRLSHQAFLIRRQIRLACHEFDWVLGLLIMVCCFLIILPVITIIQDQQHHIHWHYYFRDAFVMTFGMLALIFSIGSTSRLTEECHHFMQAVTDLAHCSDQLLRGYSRWMPPLKSHDDFIKYITNPHFQDMWGFNIHGTKVERRHLYKFMYLLFSLMLFIFFDIMGGNI